MLARGLSEAWTSSMVSEREALETAPLLGDPSPSLVRLINPMSREGQVMRPNPVAGLLRACAHNLRQGAPAVRLFEVGAGFTARAGDLPLERRMLAAIASGPGFAHAHSDEAVVAADSALQPLDILGAKGLWEAWLEEMRVDTPIWRAYAAAGWKLGASAEVASGTSHIGWAGSLSQPLLRGWDIDVPVHLFVVLLDALSEDAAGRARATLPGRFPPVRRDLAFFVPGRITQAALAETLRGVGGETLVSLELFDVYAGVGTPEGMKSLAFALRFQHPERTLTEDEIQQLQESMTTAAARECGAQLRER